MLVEYMKQHNMFDTEEGLRQRLLILGKLNELMKKWIVQVSKEKVRKLGSEERSKLKNTTIGKIRG